MKEKWFFLDRRSLIRLELGIYKSKLGILRK